MSTLADNLARLAPILARLEREGIRHRIAGEWRDSADGATFATTSPVDGTHIADVARGGP
ncbi:MAG: 5-carboxymethyl-2-hydroxymuconate semialdehyde dehydrogenase, partial [Alphaproteobacteria bacterium]